MTTEYDLPPKTYVSEYFCKYFPNQESFVIGSSSLQLWDIKSDKLLPGKQIEDHYAKVEV